MIEVTQLTKSYGSRTAVSDINFSIKSGEVIGFLGPNGAGKTTTMRMLTGYIPPTAGSIRIGNFDMQAQPLEAKSLLGYLPENVPLYLDMTVLDYLEFMADIRRIKSKRLRALETLEKVQLVDRANSIIGNLSKGMRQRVGLAQAILHTPPVLILDEPTVGLDPAQISEIRKLIKSLGKEHTILLSTHILPEVQQVCDRVLIINKGNLIAEDTPDQLQKKVSGSLRLQVTLSKIEEPHISIIKNIPGFHSLKLINSNTMEIEYDPSTEIRPRIARELVTCSAEILEIKQVTLNLEEVFLELTREEYHSDPQNLN
jgi:ABC-2 type transport system ATP-binding protein